MRTRHTASRARGFSLVELMVAVSIGLLLVLAMVSLYTSSRRTYSVTDEVARMQENARIAFTILDRQVRQVGYRRYDTDGIFSTNTATARPSGAGIATRPLTAQNDVAGDPNTSDRITVRFFGSSREGANPAVDRYTADGSIVNCVGRAIATNEVNIETYFVANGSNGEPGLRCRSEVFRADNATTTPNWTSDTIDANGVELVSGVESLQILYGDDMNADGAIDRYLKSDDAARASLDDVTAVRLSVLMRTISNANDRPDTGTYRHFGTNYTATGDNGATVTMTGGDKRLRRIFQTTITLRNRMFN
jgi:type IV pilus assembly protein PilW